MIINLDRPFVLELQDRGFVLDYKMLVSIYRDSRQRPEAKVQRRRRAREMQLLEAHLDKWTDEVNGDDDG